MVTKGKHEGTKRSCFVFSTSCSTIFSANSNSGGDDQLVRTEETQHVTSLHTF